MNKDELLEMIREEIHSLAFETLRSNAKEKEDNKNRIFKPKGLSEEDIEHNMFYGGVAPKKNGMTSILNIKEGYDNGMPKITTTEIIEFEDSFEEMLQEIDGASVAFDTQKNGYSLNMGMVDGIEGGASGTIEMGDKGKIAWAYSLKNGLTISTEDLKIEQGNKRVLEKLYNHYDVWQKEWREKLTIQPGKEVDEPAEEAGMPAEPVAEPGAAPEAAPEMGGAEELV